MSDIRSFVDTIFDELVSIRRDIHAHPELGMHEVRTSALIRSELEKMGVDEIRQPLPTAVVALIHGKKGPGKCVALRADIDALPVHEETGLPFASETEGIMHACGHDLHTTMLLGAAKTLCHMRDQFAGTVKLIFEPSEDLMPGGARALVAAGVMENPHVDAIFGQHVCPSEKDSVGRMQLYKGYFTSAVDLFHISVHGKSGHGAAPHTARDAIACAGYLITVLQTVVSRRIDPMDTAVLTVGTMSGGDAVNITAGEARMVAVLRHSGGPAHLQGHRHRLRLRHRGGAGGGLRAPVQRPRHDRPGQQGRHRCRRQGGVHRQALLRQRGLQLLRQAHRHPLRLYDGRCRLRRERCLAPQRQDRVQRGGHEARRYRPGRHRR